jgi:hypothetical protein
LFTGKGLVVVFVVVETAVVRRKIPVPSPEGKQSVEHRPGEAQFLRATDVVF